MKTIKIIVPHAERKLDLHGQATVGSLLHEAFGAANSYGREQYLKKVDGKPANSQTVVTEKNSTITVSLRDQTS